MEHCNSPKPAEQRPSVGTVLPCIDAEHTVCRAQLRTGVAYCFLFHKGKTQGKQKEAIDASNSNRALERDVNECKPLFVG
jgi:hypothetical protein